MLYSAHDMLELSYVFQFFIIFSHIYNVIMDDLKTIWLKKNNFNWTHTIDMKHRIHA